jgi:hypothetical protein
MKTFTKLLCAAAIASVGTFANANVIINSGATGTTGAGTHIDVTLEATSTITGGTCTGTDCSATIPTSTFTEFGSGVVTGLLPGGFSGVFDSGLNNTWGINAVYTGLTGDYSIGFPKFNATGYVDLFYVSNVGTEQVARLLVGGGIAEAANVNLSGIVDYSWLATATDTGNTSADAKTFFEHTTASNGFTNFYDIWLDSTTANVTWDFDFTVTQPNKLYTGNSASAVRVTDLNGQIAFSVPEPSTIAILGLGLLGFAGASRRRKS